MALSDDETGPWPFAEQYAQRVGAAKALELRAGIDTELIGFELEPLTDREWDMLVCALMTPQLGRKMLVQLDALGEDRVKQHIFYATMLKGQDPNRAYVNARMLALGLKPPTDEMHAAAEKVLADPEMRGIVAKISSCLENPEIVERAAAAIRRDPKGAIH